MQVSTLKCNLSIFICEFVLKKKKIAILYEFLNSSHLMWPISDNFQNVLSERYLKMFMNNIYIYKLTCNVVIYISLSELNKI